MFLVLVVFMYYKCKGILRLNMKASEKNVEKIKGKPKSGRIWKPEHKKFSKLTIQSSNRTSWGKKMAIKNEKKLLQDREKQIKEELKQNKIVRNLL